MCSVCVLRIYAKRARVCVCACVHACVSVCARACVRVYVVGCHQADADRPDCTAANRGDFYLNTDGTDDELLICMLVSGATNWRAVNTSNF